jgi:hypothetical protein
VTPAGISTAAVHADSATDFGNGQDSLNLLLGVQSNYDLVQFDTTGKVLFRETVPSINSSLNSIFGLVTNASGFLWATGSQSMPLNLNVTNLTPLTAGITSSGGFGWEQTDTRDAQIAASPNGAIQLIVNPPNSMETASESLQALASNGSSAWTTSTPMSSNAPQGGDFIVDSSGNPLIAAMFQGTVTFGSAPAVTSAGADDIVYQVYDGAGHLQSVGSWGGPNEDNLGGIGVDPAGNIVMAGSTSQTTSSLGTSSVFFVKLPR